MGTILLNVGRYLSMPSTSSFRSQVSVLASSTAPMSDALFMFMSRSTDSSDSSPLSGAFHFTRSCTLRP